jgi:hypothetical protein
MRTTADDGDDLLASSTATSSSINCFATPLLYYRSIVKNKAFFSFLLAVTLLKNTAADRWVRWEKWAEETANIYRPAGRAWRKACIQMHAGYYTIIKTKWLIAHSSISIWVCLLTDLLICGDRFILKEKNCTLYESFIYNVNVCHLQPVTVLMQR